MKSDVDVLAAYRSVWAKMLRAYDPRRNSRIDVNVCRICLKPLPLDRAAIKTCSDDCTRKYNEIRRRDEPLCVTLGYEPRNLPTKRNCLRCNRVIDVSPVKNVYMCDNCRNTVNDRPWYIVRGWHDEEFTDEEATKILKANAAMDDQAQPPRDGGEL